jgi:hypothetical protein
MAGESVRELILTKIVDMLATIPVQLPATDPLYPLPDPYPFKFSHVELGPLDMGDHKRKLVAGVVPGRETKRELFPVVEPTLPVNIEFRATRDKGDAKPGILAEKIITVIQRCIYADKTIGDLALDTVETGNEVDLDTYGDATIVGVVFFEVKYRHSHRDPRNPYPEV